LAVEPFGYVVDRVLIEALVEAARNVSDVRSRQQVRQAPQGMIKRQRLLIEDVNGRARDLAFSTIGPRDVFTSLAVGFMSASSASPTSPRVRPLSTRWTLASSAR
jgi:hypothetical protein